MRKIFSSPDFKKVIILETDGYVDPIIYDSQDSVDLDGQEWQDFLNANEKASIEDALTHFGWTQVTAPVDIAGVMFFADAEGEDYPHETWREQAVEMATSVTPLFAENVAKMNGFM